MLEDITNLQLFTTFLIIFILLYINLFAIIYSQTDWSVTTKILVPFLIAFPIVCVPGFILYYIRPETNEEKEDLQTRKEEFMQIQRPYKFPTEESTISED